MKTLLVVDDDPTIRLFINKALQRKGWTVLEAEDGIDGTARFLLHQPDVILTDISMPHSDGFTMLTALRNSGDLRGTRVVLMSGVVDLTDDRIKEAKVSAILRKPIHLKELYAAIGEPDNASNSET